MKWFKKLSPAKFGNLSNNNNLVSTKNIIKSSPVVSKLKSQLIDIEKTVNSNGTSVCEECKYALDAEANNGAFNWRTSSTTDSSSRRTDDCDCDFMCQCKTDVESGETTPITSTVVNCPPHGGDGLDEFEVRGSESVARCECASKKSSAYPKNNRRNLRAQARKLERLIAPENVTVTSAFLANRHIIDPDDFFEDPTEVKLYRDEVKFFSDWIIVEEFEETSLQEVDISSGGSSFEDIVADPFADVQLSVNSYSAENDFIYSCNCSSSSSLDSDNPEASCCCSLTDDIQSGRKLFPSRKMFLSTIWSEVSAGTKSKTVVGVVDRHYENDSFAKGRKLANRSDFSLMGSLLLKEPEFCPLYNSTFSSIESRLEKLRKSKNFSIQKYFGLNDDGDIIIHLNHIVVYEGFGFITKSGPKVSYGTELKEKPIRWWNNRLGDGHPRNKSASGGPGDTIGAYTLSLAADQNSTFARNIENFISCTKESREVAPQVVMRNMRQFMSGMKNYLVKHGEADFQIEVQRARSLLKFDEFLNLDTILEGVMHRLVVLPLREHLYGLFVDFYKKSGDIQLLVDNIKYAYQRSAADFGIQSSVTPPSLASLRQISTLLVKLQEAELPLDKLELLLAAVSAIFESTGSRDGQKLGADDFLPLLVLVVAKTGFYSAEIEAEFMYGLLQPSLLTGEAGYYLTALCSAVHVLKSFMSSESEGHGSLDWRSSSLPASSSVLRVIIPDEYNGSLQTRTLPVRPHTTTKDVCRTIAHKAKITNPQDYGLFKLVDGEETLLMENECPQDVRLSTRGKHCVLAFKRIEAKIAWPKLNPSTY